MRNNSMNPNNPLLLIFLSLGAIFSGCDDRVTGPTPDTNLLSNSSFEFLGDASLEGWSYHDTSSVHFSNDVPSNGGNYSITVEATSMPPPAYFVRQAISSLQGEERYHLSSWAKTTGLHGSLRLELKRGETIVDRKSIYISDSTWTTYSLIDTLTASSGDSLVVTLSGGLSNLLPGTTFFDICRLERLD